VTDQFQSEPYPSAPYPGGNTMTAASPYASWIQRVGAYLIDIAPIIVVDLILGRISVVLSVLIWLAGVAWTAYNRWYQAGTTGQSLGKKVLKLRLVSEETGQPIGMLMAFVRDICHIIDSVICFIGYLFPLWDAKRQTIADKIVKTVVIPAP
jgi:uncharacterized RDD family membrane protein YckC